MNERIDKIAGQGGTEEISRRVFLNWTGSTALLASTGLLTKVGRAYPASAGKVIRMGVVGGGFGAHFHWHQHPNCKVTGVTDLRPERRDTLRKNYLCDAVYDSLEEMIKKAKDIDAVAIFSGAPDHAKHVKMCMERGWHVVSACPACMSVQEAEMMKEVKGKTGLKYMMAESSWYRQPTIYARNMYKAGEFGELIYSEAEYYHNFANMHTTPENKGTLFRMPDGKRTWRWGLPPMHYPTHSLGFLTGVTGERITKVSCLGYGNPDSPVLKDNRYNNPFWNEAAMMKTNKGNMCRCNVFWKVRSGGERAQWIGSKGALYMALYQVHGNAKLPPDGKGGAVQIPEYWKTSEMLPDSMRLASGHGGSAVFISAEFINALLEEREPEIDLYESLAMTVPGIIAHQSALKDGEQLKVPNFDRKT
ncbi:MAG: Gfo/Idh/MocA family oxidoreductase [Planctomycetota bacterium]|nr:MAG: Gfo/Idh/MocA family oxidoreductase [Planctomycetota bacterium]